MSGGLGSEDLEKDQMPPDFDRKSNGQPLIPDAETGKVVAYTRSSGLGDVLDDKTALTNWLVSKGIEGCALDQSIVARAVAASPYEENKPMWGAIRDDAARASKGSAKRDIGTAVHAMTDRFEQDESWEPGPQYLPALEAFVSEMKRLGLKSQLFECAFVNDASKTAGTADRLIELTKPLVAPDGTILHPGELLIGDTKTGDSLEYSMAGYAVQLSDYAGGTLYDVVSNERLPTPAINQSWAIIFHLNAEEAHCEMVWVDLEVGRYGAELAEAVREWRRNWRRKGGYKASVLPVVVASPDVLGSPSEPDPVEDQVAAPEAAPDRIPELEDRPAVDDLEAWKAYIRTRLQVIGENDAAKAWMLPRWPKHLPPPKKLTTLLEAQELDDFIARVEAEFGLPFASGQPVPERKKKASVA